MRKRLAILHSLEVSIFPLFFVSLVVVTAIRTSPAQTSSSLPKVELRDLKSIIETRPDSLIGYSLVDAHTGPGVHYGSITSRAMVMSLETGRSYELLRGLPSVVPRAATAFGGWLPDHRTAIVQAVFFPMAHHAGDSQDYWIDEYIVSLRTGLFFTPTGLMASGYQNNGMLPFKSSTESGYLFFTGVGPGLSDEYTMHFDGGNKTPFPTAQTNRFGAHGCWTSPNGELTACELAHCDGAIQACIQIFNAQTGAAGARFGPSPIGAVSWSPDSKHFVYLGGTNPPTYYNPLMLVDVQKSSSIRIGGNVIHNAGPGHGAASEQPFDGGTELGQWSASGDSYYTSIVVGSGANEYNRIGRIPLANPGTFVPLTPEGIDVRYPALAPRGNSFVCLALSNKPGESPIQIYRVDSDKGGHTPTFRKISHVAADKVPNLPSWRSQTNLRPTQTP
jgi:hypothetical protein